VISSVAPSVPSGRWFPEVSLPFEQKREVMILDERRLSALIRRLADQAGDSSEIPKGLGVRSRLRIFRNATIGGVAAIAFIGVGVLAANELMEDTSGPVAPSPKPSPKPTNKQVNIRGEIAFLSDRGQRFGQHIFVIRANGSGLRQITQTPADSSKVGWSPDSRQIVMDRGLGEGRGSLVILDTETGEESVVLSDAGIDGRTPLTPQSPSWSPEGSRIAFASGEGDIYVIGVDGRDLGMVTDSGRRCGDLYPEWSPDGNQIAFTRDCLNGGIFVVSSDGGIPERVTGYRRDLQPAWSPDGAHIAFTRGLLDIYVVDVSTGLLTQLTETIDSYSPSWSPDGSTIV
jgi:Tol biopolymer transport system component